MDLEEIWRIREEEVYPRLFGPLSRGIFPLSLQLFSERFGQQDIDPRWLFLGVLEFAPTAARPYWLYVTSGHSNPWDDDPEDYDPEGQSGSGVEFTLATVTQSDWAIETLQSLLAFDLLLDSGRFPQGQRLSLHDRVPLRRPIDGRPDCQLRNVVMAKPEGFEDEFSLPSGSVLFVTFVGVTDNEIELARSAGSPALIDRLRAEGHFPTTDPQRDSIC